jgi:hypothetical protein
MSDVEIIKLVEVLSGTSTAEPIEFLFQINPNRVSISGGLNIKTQSIVGMDGDIKQILGRIPKTITMSGTFIKGYSRKNQKEYTYEELLAQFQQFTEKKTIFRLAGIFANYIGALNVIIPSNSLEFSSSKPKSFNYTLNFVEWTDFNISVVKKDQNLVGQQQALNNFVTAAQRNRIRIRGSS